MVIESGFDQRRRYPRHKAPKGMFVGWKSANQRAVSHAESVGMGGLFLDTANPPSKGSIIELLFDLKTGEVRARAVVRHSHPGHGMGVQFVQMQAADRARLNQFLSKYSETPSAVEANAESRCAQTLTESPFATKPKDDVTAQFERELTSVLEMARQGTFYQLLGVSPDSTAKQIKQNFYALAQRFHPDHHMESKEPMSRLKELMGVATTAYKTLVDEEKRAQYDAHLAASGAYNLHREKSTSQETIKQYFGRATECLRAGNFIGSIVWLRKCTEMAPNEARYHALLARSLSSVTQYRDETIEEFQRAIELDPLNTAPYIQLAELYESMGLPSRAYPLYSKVREINPLHAKVQDRLLELDREKA